MAKVIPAVASLSAVDTASPSVHVAGYFNISLSGQWAGTVALERSFDEGETWRSVSTFTANVESVGLEPEGAAYRFVVTAYTSGTVLCRISQ